YQQALTLLQQQLSAQHPDRADILYGLARLHHLQHNRTQALSFYQQAQVIRQQVYGPDHPKTKQTEDALSLLVQDLQQQKAMSSTEVTAPASGSVLVCA